MQTVYNAISGCEAAETVRQRIVDFLDLDEEIWPGMVPRSRRSLAVLGVDGFAAEYARMLNKSAAPGAPAADPEKEAAVIRKAQAEFQRKHAALVADPARHMIAVITDAVRQAEHLVTMRAKAKSQAERDALELLITSIRREALNAKQERVLAKSESALGARWRAVFGVESPSPAKAETEAAA